MCLTCIISLIIQKLRGKPFPFPHYCLQSSMIKCLTIAICIFFLTFLLAVAFSKENCYNVDLLGNEVKTLKSNGKNVSYHRIKMMALNSVNHYRRDDVSRVFRFCEIENWRKKIQCLTIKMLEICPELKPLAEKLKKRSIAHLLNKKFVKLIKNPLK